MPRTSIPNQTTAELRREFAEAALEEFLTRRVVAPGIGYSQSYLELRATKGGGPPFYKRGRRVLYKKSDVLAWLEANSQRVTSTSQYPSAIGESGVHREQRAPSPSSRRTVRRRTK